MKTTPLGLNKKLLPIYDSLETYFKEYSNDKATVKNSSTLFSLVLKATLVKSFEFNLAVIRLKGDSIFFMLPSLRGICEEFIAERFIQEHFGSDKGNVIQLWQQHGLLQSCIAQWNYFKENKPSQKLYYKKEFETGISDMEMQIKVYLKKTFPNHNFRGVFPSTYHMAKEVGLTDLYNYLYHAASTFVHFHPNNLLRMGWGDVPKIQFSTSNFRRYYSDFTVFYGALLFCNLCEWHVSSGYLPDFETHQIKTIRAILDAENRWPEIVTFDEMNIGALSRHLFFNSPEEITE